MSNGMDFVAEHFDEIRAMLFRLCERMQYAQRGNVNHKQAVAGLVDDVFSECILEVADRIYDKYDCRIGTLEGFMFAQMRLYARKWFQTLRVRQSRFVSSEDDDKNDSRECDCGINELLDHEQVILYLGKLTEREERIVRMHVGFDQSFEEIAERLGGGASTVCKTFNLAITRLRDLAKYDSANKE